MRKEVIQTGKSVDDAINAACKELGCERDACEWEIVDLPKKTFLGLKMIPAKVKVWIDLPDEKKDEPKEQTKRQERPTPQGTGAEREQAKPKVEQSAREPEAKIDEPELEMESILEPAEPRVRVTENFSEKEELAMQYVDEIVRNFGLNAQIEVYRVGDHTYINIAGDGLGAIIGRRGENLDAIQYLTGLVVNRLKGDYLRITVDCGDYRTKRKQTLEALARKLAAQVLKTDVSKTLEPMNPFERRVIHATVSTIAGVSSSSIGEEPNRRVVITTPTARRPSRGYGRGGSTGGRGREDRFGRDRGDRDRGDRDRRHGGDRHRSADPRSAAPKLPEGPPKETPEAAVMGNAPMGKLDLE